MSETLIEAWRSASDYHGHSVDEFQAWLGAIARNKALNLARSEFRRRRVFRVIYIDKLSPEAEPQSAAPSPEERLALLEEQEKIRRLLPVLDPMSSHVVMLRFFEGYSVGKIAHLLHLTTSATKKRLSRSLEKLRMKYLSKERLT